MTRPYMHLSVDGLEAIAGQAACPGFLIHELLVRLRAKSAIASTFDARAVPVTKAERKPVARSKMPAKPVAAVRASGAHPGSIPDSWEACTKAQLAWWRDRYSWHSTLFVSRFPKRSPAEMMDVVKRADKWASRTKRKAIPAGRTVAEFAGDTGLAYVLPRTVLKDRWNGHKHEYETVVDWSTTPNRELVQRVAETDPTHYSAISRRILAEIAARDAPTIDDPTAYLDSLDEPEQLPLAA